MLRAKIGYTALQAHLGELVIRLGESHGLDEPAAWRAVRAVVDETYDGLGGDPVRDAAADHAGFTAAAGAAQGAGPDAAGRRRRQLPPGPESAACAA